MSKPSNISYGVRPEDDGSDMDVSSDDEGLHMYQSMPNHQQDQLPHASQEQQSGPMPVSGSDSSASRLTTNTNCWTTFVDKVAQHQTPISVRDGASDTDSTSSFHTAPNSPIDLTLDDDQDTDMDPQQQPPDIINELISQQERLTQELEHHTNEEKRIDRLLKEKRAKLEEIRVQQLELQVRKSIQKNRKTVIAPKRSRKGKEKAPIDRPLETLANSKKGKEKAPLDEPYRSCSDSDEYERQQPPRKAKAIVDVDSGRPKRQLVEESDRAESDVETMKEPVRQESDVEIMKEPVRQESNGGTVKGKEAQKVAKKNGVKWVDQQPGQRKALVTVEERAPNTTIKPYVLSIPKQNKQTVQAIRKSQQLGHTSVGQMKMFLCDLYDKFLEDGKLTRIQKVHYKELVRQVSKYDGFGDDHIPGKATPKKAKKLERKMIQPEKRRMLPNEFYGHPKNLDFKNYKVDRHKLMDALTCSEIEAPPILVKARNVFSKQSIQLALADFEGVIGPDGEVVEREELMNYMGNRKINRLLTLYKETVNKSAPSTSMTVSERSRHEYYLAQRRLEESVMRQNGTDSPEPSTVENPLVSDNSTDALNSVMVSLAPSSKRADARPITTITYIPNETSFIRSILPGGREPVNAIKSPPPPPKLNPVQQSRPTPPQPNPSKAPVSLPPTPPVKKPTPTPTPFSSQIPTIPKNNPPSLSAPNPPSLSSTHSHTTHTQSSAPTAPPPSQQNKSSTSFQPYRSALGSLGVTRSVDVIQPKKTGILCRAESNGGVCNDKSCQDMHFTDFS